jgi:3-hydroxyacyl-[acyl-carrier-protein] dehydratase
MNPALPFFADHFPGNPLVPGVLLIECAAQAAGCLWSERRQDPRFTATVAQVNLFRFLREVRPDQTVEVTVKLEKDFGTLAQFEAELRVEDTPVALGRLTLSQGRSP